MLVVFKVKLPKVEIATEMANALLVNSEFIQKIRDKDSFDMSTASPQVIADLIEASRLEMEIKLFYPTGENDLKYIKTFAFTNRKMPNILFLNLKKLNRTTESIAATIIHECIHVIDNAASEYTFGHGDNSSKGKGNTAPYWIGNLANKMLHANAAELVFDQEEDSSTDTIV
jgi:hypothetical protein